MKVEQKDASKNFILQFAYQTIILIIPLFVSPYLTRKLGKTALGEYSYVYSIVYYFVAFANLGIAKYGQREIARNTGDMNNLRRCFWSIFDAHIFFSIISIIIFYIGVLIINPADKWIFLIEGIFIVAALFDITWLFYGMENFKSVVTKNLFIKIIECVSIVILVKSVSDLWKYIIISSCSILCGNVILTVQAVTTINPIKVNFHDIVIHIKPLLILSISVFAISLYSVFDRTILGIMTNKENVAFYEYADKVVMIPRVFCTIIGTVLFPKACRLVDSDDVRGQNQALEISIIVVFFIGAASLFGLLAIAKEFSVIYYGQPFEPSGYVMMSMCGLPLIVGIGDIIRMQCMIPRKMDKQYTICIVGNAVINVTLSMSLIPSFGIYGAVIGTCSAELFGCIAQIIICRKYISAVKILKEGTPFLLIGLVMFAVIIFLKQFFKTGIISLLIQIVVGGIVFILFSIIYLVAFKKSLLFTLLKKNR